MDKCSSCKQMKTENKLIRTSLLETNKLYVEVVNENLALRRKLEEFDIYYGDINV